MAWRVNTFFPCIAFSVLTKGSSAPLVAAVLTSFAATALIYSWLSWSILWPLPTHVERGPHRALASFFQALEFPDLFPFWRNLSKSGTFIFFKKCFYVNETKWKAVYKMNESILEDHTHDVAFSHKVVREVSITKTTAYIITAKISYVLSRVPSISSYNPHHKSWCS